MLNRLLGLAVAAALAALTAAALTAATPATATPAAASANDVLNWYGYAGRELNQAAQLRGQPQRARLEMAMVQGAVYDAVNAIARTNQPYLTAPAAQPWYSQDAAASTAAYRVLIALLPDRQTALQPLYEQSLAAIPDGAAKTGGIRVGDEAAAGMLAARENDGRDGPRKPVIGTEPGVWRPTPPDYAIADTAWIGDVKPFLIPSAEGLRDPRSQPARERDLRKGVQRDQGARGREQHHPDRRTDGDRAVLGPGALGRDHRLDRPKPEPRCQRHGTHAGDGEPRRRRRRDHVHQREELLEHLAADHRDSGSGLRR
jgi:hypothetical protein